MSSSKISTGEVQPQGIGEDPLFWTTKLFVRFLQVVFHTFEKGAFRWDPDLETTDLVVSDQSVLRSEVVEKRPAIVCMRGPARWSNVSMDQFKSMDFDTGTKTHTDLIQSVMVYCCLSREGLEAQRIAWIASYATRTLKKTLLRAGLHRVGENVDIGAETDPGNLVPDSAKDLRLVSVTVPFFFQDTYSIGPVDNLLLKHMDLSLRSRERPVADELSKIRPPSIGGKTIQPVKTYSLTQRVKASSLPAPKKP